MVRKDSGKSAALSQEYIIDSESDGVADGSATVAKSAKPLHHSTPRKKKQKKDDRISSTGNATQTESLHSDGTVDGELEGVEASPSSSEISSNEGEPESRRKSRAMPKLQKKQKTASTYGFYCGDINRADNETDPKRVMSQFRHDLSGLLMASTKSGQRALISPLRLWRR
jgi:hypothetical protein